ncbi:MAG: TonB-dependent receptor [Bacteroidota bacterium]
MKVWCLGIFLGVNFSLLSQDTTLIQEVEVKANLLWNRDSLVFVPELRRKKIEQIQAEDIGQLLQLFSGVQVKSYGGIGGLKSVSIRGLGGQHTAFVVNGVAVPPDQTGQMNLGTIQTDNLERISLSYSGSELLPASSLCFGSTISMETFEGSFSSTNHALRATQKYGSFGQVDSYVAYKKGDSKNRYFVAASGKIRSFGGKYPFSIKNGSQQYEGVRENNHYRDLNFNIGAGCRFRNESTLKLHYQKLSITQELPGPIVLYTATANQDLMQKNDQLQLSYNYELKKWMNGNVFVLLKNTDLQYVDSNYLNAEGLMKSDYNLQLMDVGLNFSFPLTKKMKLNFSNEGQFQKMQSNTYSENAPQRFHYFSALIYQLTLGKYLILETQGSLQAIVDNHSERKSQIHLNPFVQFKTIPLWNKRISGYFSYRNSFRMPSFNELYYNKIGNLDLLPEKAHQLAIGAEYSSATKSFGHLLRFNAYANKVSDKIVAVPTMNLFLWSIQNIGKVEILGVDLHYTLGVLLAKVQKLELGMNYNFQSVKDKTDKFSPTYNHQIAYMPKHSGNVDLTYSLKSYSLRIGVFANDTRYSLNENVEANRVDAFLVTDISVHAYWKIKEKSKLSLLFSCKNLFNQSYALVRNYVMPGRNFLISLSYAFN